MRRHPYREPDEGHRDEPVIPSGVDPEEITVHAVLVAVGAVGVWLGVSRGHAFDLVMGALVVVLGLRAFAGFAAGR